MWFVDFGRQPNWKLKSHNQPKPKISKWFFSHVFTLSHWTQNIWQKWIWMSRTHFISFWSFAIFQCPGKVKSHNKIAQKLEVLKTLWELKCEFWNVLNFFTVFHANRSWQNAKIHKLDKQDEQPISCAEGEILTENWKFEHDSIRWYFHVGSWRNMFQSNVRFISWDSDENVWMQSRMNELVSWSSMKEKFWSLVKKWFEFRKQVKVNEKFEFSYLKSFLTQKTWMEWQNLKNRS